jgi:hypothetical protein
MVPTFGAGLRLGRKFEDYLLGRRFPIVQLNYIQTICVWGEGITVFFVLQQVELLSKGILLEFFLHTRSYYPERCA